MNKQQRNFIFKLPMGPIDIDFILFIEYFQGRVEKLIESKPYMLIFYCMSYANDHVCCTSFLLLLIIAILLSYLFSPLSYCILCTSCLPSCLKVVKLKLIGRLQVLRKLNILLEIQCDFKSDISTAISH